MRRAGCWISSRSEARKTFEARALRHGEILGVKPSRITVRDTASRWGSCSSARSLSFSWRLILAPDFVLDYVVAHEVAHMRADESQPALLGGCEEAWCPISPRPSTGCGPMAASCSATG